MIHLGHIRVSDSREVLLYFLSPAIPIERWEIYGLPTHLKSSFILFHGNAVKII